LKVCDTLNHASGNCGIAIDTGTSLFAGPTNYINTILKMLDVKEDCSNYD